MDGIMSFVLKLSANTPVSIEYSTYIGPGTASAIDVDDASGDAFIAGTTSTFTFPTTPGVLQPAHGGTWGSDAYVLRMNSTGTGLVYSTFLGGADYEGASGIVINSANEAYVTGIAQTDFPTSPGAFQPNNAGSYDFYAVHLNATATAYGCGGSTYIGGSDADYSGSFYDYPSPRISLRDHGGNNDTILITSTSHSQDFPTTPGVYGPVKVNGIADQPVFFKLTCFNAALPTAAFIAPDSICPGACVDFVNQSQNGTSYLWTFQGASISSSTDVNPTAVCYANPGTYAVTLVAINANGTNSATSYITVYPSPPPQGIQQSGDTLIANQGAVGYQWYYNGNIIPGATGYFHIAQANGNYNVVATDANGCEVEAAIFDVLVWMSDIVLGHDFLIYPNPAGYELTIACRVQAVSNDDLCSVEGINLYNALGQKVICSGIYHSSGAVSLDISMLEPGVYFVEVELSGQVVFQKFIKE
jgi:PKD repeat protein